MNSEPAITTEQFEQSRRTLSAKYGRDLDPELLPLILEMESLQQRFTAMEDRISQHLHPATIKQVVLRSKGEAFWFGFGRWGAVLTTAVLCVFGGYLLWFYREESRLEAARLTREIATAQQLITYRELAQLTPIYRDKRGQQYIELTPVADFTHAQVGRNVIIDLPRRIVQIPLRVSTGGPQ